MRVPEFKPNSNFQQQMKSKIHQSKLQQNSMEIQSIIKEAKTWLPKKFGRQTRNDKSELESYKPLKFTEISIEGSSSPEHSQGVDSDRRTKPSYKPSVMVQNQQTSGYGLRSMNSKNLNSEEFYVNRFNAFSVKGINKIGKISLRDTYWKRLPEDKRSAKYNEYIESTAPKPKQQTEEAKQ